MDFNLFDLSLRPRSPSQVIQLADRLQHSHHGDFAGVEAKAAVWAETVMDIRVHVTFQIDGFGVREGLSVMGSSDL